MTSFSCMVLLWGDKGIFIQTSAPSLPATPTTPRDHLKACSG